MRADRVHHERGPSSCVHSEPPWSHSHAQTFKSNGMAADGDFYHAEERCFKQGVTCGVRNLFNSYVIVVLTFDLYANYSI